MSKVLPILLSGACLVFSSLSHSATTLISFDDVALNGDTGVVNNGYKGLNWINVRAVNPFLVASWGFGNNGAANGIVSLSNVAFNASASLSASPIEFSAVTPFTFNSAYFAGIWNDGLNLTVRGLNGGTIVNTASFTVGTSGPTLKQFDWANLDSVTISASGGTHNTQLSGGGGTYFAFDNMIINGPVAAVPEATTVTMMLAGLSILGVVGLRRKKV